MHKNIIKEHPSSNSHANRIVITTRCNPTNPQMVVPTLTHVFPSQVPQAHTSPYLKTYHQTQQVPKQFIHRKYNIKLRRSHHQERINFKALR